MFARVLSLSARLCPHVPKGIIMTAWWEWPAVVENRIDW